MTKDLNLDDLDGITKMMAKLPRMNFTTTFKTLD